MSPRHPSSAKATVFAALGDETRLLLLAKLGSGESHSIANLTAGTNLTRQAVTKHLRVLERVRLVRARRCGRERIFALDPQPIHELAAYLERVSNQWEGALTRLKAFAERE